MAVSTRRILCYGGSFNPIHNGHLICAQAVAEAAGFEQILLIPSACPPHRQGQVDLAPAKARLTMCQLAVTSAAGFAVSDIELRQNGPSYTIQTARALAADGHGKVQWLIGGDTLPQLPTWHDFPRLLQEIEFIIMQRPDWPIPWEDLDESLQRLRQSVVDAPLIQISASEVRHRVRTGRDIRFYTPPAVAAYIAETGLYRALD